MPLVNLIYPPHQMREDHNRSVLAAQEAAFAARESSSSSGGAAGRPPAEAVSPVDAAADAEGFFDDLAAVPEESRGPAEESKHPSGGAAAAASLGPAGRRHNIICLATDPLQAASLTTVAALLVGQPGESGGTAGDAAAAAALAPQILLMHCQHASSEAPSSYMPHVDSLSMFAAGDAMRLLPAELVRGSGGDGGLSVGPLFSRTARCVPAPRSHCRCAQVLAASSSGGGADGPEEDLSRSVAAPIRRPDAAATPRTAHGGPGGDAAPLLAPQHVVLDVVVGPAADSAAVTGASPAASPSALVRASASTRLRQGSATSPSALAGLISSLAGTPRLPALPSGMRPAELVSRVSSEAARLLGDPVLFAGVERARGSAHRAHVIASLQVRWRGVGRWQ